MCAISPTNRDLEAIVDRLHRHTLDQTAQQVIAMQTRHTFENFRRVLAAGGAITEFREDTAKVRMEYLAGSGTGRNGGSRGRIRPRG